MTDEYTALRDEVLARMAAQDQLVYLALLVTGALLSFRFSKKELPNAALYMQPSIVFLLAMGWAFNDFRIAHIGLYIRTYHEVDLAVPGWEHFMTRSAQDLGAAVTGSFVFVQAIGVFVGSQCISLVAAKKMRDFGLSSRVAAIRDEWESVNQWMLRVARWSTALTALALVVVAVVSVRIRFT